MISFHLPKIRMVAVLLVLALFALGKFFSFDLLLRFLAILAITLSAEYTFWRLRKVPPFVPSAGIVTALIIFLVSDPESSHLATAIAILTAIGVKQFLRPGSLHIFNPAASGLFIGSLFGLLPSWWGIGWGYIPLTLTLLGAGYVSFVYAKQYRIIIPFLLTSILTTIIVSGHPLLAVNQLLVGPFWFFTLVMLPEPVTAVHKPKMKIQYSVFAAFLPFLLAKIGLPSDPLILTLLAANGTFKMLEQEIDLKDILKRTNGVLNKFPKIP